MEIACNSNAISPLDYSTPSNRASSIAVTYMSNLKSTPVVELLKTKIDSGFVDTHHLVSYPHGLPGDCFRNAMRYVSEHPTSHDYVEGFEYLPGLPPVEHAWVYNRLLKQHEEITMEMESVKAARLTSCRVGLIVPSLVALEMRKCELYHMQPVLLEMIGRLQRYGKDRYGAKNVKLCEKSWFPAVQAANHM